LIYGHHEGYIDWTEFDRNQRLISENANGKSFIPGRLGMLTISGVADRDARLVRRVGSIRGMCASES
jgi:hypothetical protein